MAEFFVGERTENFYCRERCRFQNLSEWNTISYCSHGLQIHSASATAWAKTKI